MVTAVVSRRGSRRDPRSPRRLACRASSGRTGGSPMHGEAPPASSWRGGPDAAWAGRPAPRSVAVRPRGLGSASVALHLRAARAALPCKASPLGRSRGRANQASHILESTAMASSGRTGGPPMAQLAAHGSHPSGPCQSHGSCGERMGPGSPGCHPRGRHKRRSAPRATQPLGWRSGVGGHK